MTALVRVLTWVLVLILVIAVVLWLAARRADRGTIEQEITIGRPPAAVFRWISSEDLVRRWIADLLELRKEEAAASPESASYRLVEVISGHRVAMKAEVVRLVPNQDLWLALSSPDSSGFSAEAQFKLIGNEEYTRLVFTSHARFASLADQISEPILTFLTDRKMKDDLARLKLLLEAEPANAPTPRPASGERRP